MFSSIRARLTFWYVGILALTVIAFAAAIYVLVARNLSRTTDDNLAEIGRSIETDLRKEEADIAAERRLVIAEPAEKEEESEKESKDVPDEAPLTIEAAIAEEVADLGSRDYGFIVVDQDGKRISSTVTNPRLEEISINLGEVSFADALVQNETFRVYHMPITLDGKTFRLIITRSLREPTEFLAGLRRVFFIAVPIALILAGLGGYFLALRSLAPVISMSDQAARIGSTNLNERLEVRNEKDELGRLANVFNSMLTRLETSFDQQRQFMADASHELRTPLAIVRGESEVAISKDSRSAEEYRESLAIVHDESVRLTKIVEDLFILARADSGQLKPQFEQVFLDEILADCIRHMRVLALRKQVALNCSPFAQMSLEGDASLLRQLFINLLDNAIKYNRTGGNVLISCENFVISFADTGRGLPKDGQDKIFERFYRADKARARDRETATSGAGLGLSIAQWVAGVHGAEIRLSKSDSSGSIFAVIFPQS